MARYFTDDEVWSEPRQTMDVHEDDETFRPKPTGILNSRGKMIYREPERIGFRLAPRHRA